MSLTRRLGRQPVAVQFEDVDPAAELLEDREVPERGETPGHLDPGALAIPDIQNPWAALTGELVEQLEAGVARVAAELGARLEPLPLMRWGSAEADAAGQAVIALEHVPPSARWELGHLHAWHNAAGDIPLEVYADTGGAGGWRRVDSGLALEDQGVTFYWPAMFLGEGHRLEVRATGLSPGEVLGVGLFGRIHSAR